MLFDKKMISSEKPNVCELEKEMERITRKEDTLMSETYFSKQNIDIIQNELYLHVFKKAGFRIDKQPINDLLIIMRGVYNLYANPLTKRNHIKSEIMKLNDIFLEMTTKMIISNVKMHRKYIQDASNLPVPISRGTMESRKGEISLPSNNLV